MSDEMMMPGPDDIDTSPTANFPDDDVWYDCTALYFNPDKSSRGNPMIEVEWMIDNGEYSGFDGIREWWELGASDHNLGERRLKETMVAADFDWEKGPWDGGEWVDQFPAEEIRCALKFEYRYSVKRSSGDYDDVGKEEWDDWDGEKNVGLNIADRETAHGEPDDPASGDNITWEEGEDEGIPDDFGDGSENGQVAEEEEESDELTDAPF